MSLQQLLPLETAAQRLGLPISTLRARIEQGIIPGMALNGQILVSEREVDKLTPTPKENLPEYQKHQHLKGVPIWISEAARKYDILQATISKWVKAGYIKALGMDGNRVLVDEADMAYCAEVYRQRGGQGKWLFNKDGTPYRKMESVERRA